MSIAAAKNHKKNKASGEDTGVRHSRRRRRLLLLRHSHQIPRGFEILNEVLNEVWKEVLSSLSLAPYPYHVIPFDRRGG